MDMDHNTTDRGSSVAVIGSGISGLSAAWLLSRSMNVTLIEAEHRLGGHSNTVEVELERTVPVDTGFIVYNDRNYPNLVRLFEHLNVPTRESDMSFAASLKNGDFEYSGCGFSGLLGQKSNALKPRFWSMVGDIFRFYKQAPTALDRPDTANLTLGEYLDREKYGPAFIENHLLPMGAAIWSTTAQDMRAYPLDAFVRFFVNHGLLLLKDRPKWRTVHGGSREYVSRILADFKGQVRTGTTIVDVRRHEAGVTLKTATGTSEHFDHVVIATHADHALALLGDADAREARILGAFGYTANTAVLHSDTGLMPRRKAVWASWNYMSGKAVNEDTQLCVTYWMNRLQHLETGQDLFVTLNPSRPVDPAKTHKTIHYSHPLFDAKAMAAQKQIWQLQGSRNTWFCGAHFGSGFHEDGLQSGLAVAEQLGNVKRPWSVSNQSSRIFVDDHRMAAE